MNLALSMIIELFMITGLSTIIITDTAYFSQWQIHVRLYQFENYFVSVILSNYLKSKQLLETHYLRFYLSFLQMKKGPNRICPLVIVKIGTLWEPSIPRDAKTAANLLY